MKESVKRAWPVKRDLTERRNGQPCVEYQVWYLTQKSDGTDMENMFHVYRGVVSGRFWNLTQHIAGKLNN